MKDRYLFSLTCYCSIGLFITNLSYRYKFKYAQLVTTIIQVSNHVAIVLIPYLFMKQVEQQEPQLLQEIKLLSQLINVLTLLFFNIFMVPFYQNG